MSWETFYFFCFCLGFLCSLISFLAGYRMLWGTTYRPAPVGNEVLEVASEA